jgi:alkanesulfonate monooxygenase
MSALSFKIPAEEPASSLKFGGLQVFATSPQSLDFDSDSYLKRVVDVARWSENAGCTGTLVYTDNSIVDPWVVAQTIIANTRSLSPLVAVQPLYMHPYTVAKMVTSFAFLYGRRVYLNMVAGGFKNDLVAFNDQTPHDRRYDRLVEYTSIIKQLLESSLPTSFNGEFYKIDKLALKPSLPPELRPGVFISGSSPAGVAAATSVGATAIKYPEPPDECKPASPSSTMSSGVRVGIIAREQDDEAWRTAHHRFPSDRKGQIAHQLAMRVSDSSWHKQLSHREEINSAQDAYWLGPFQNSKSNCPYLVGNYDRVARELRRYVASGYQTFILDIPPTEEELDHIQKVFERATQQSA